jgi:flagellar hook protein FlgE
MLRSMFSAVSGLRSHQTMMDVTGNNVANVNTAGYKASRTTFQETLTQLVRGGNAGAQGQGGINPMQLGLGAQVASTDIVNTQGASQATGRPTDLAIQGNGFFLVQANGEQFLTRAGAFDLDSNGNLVNPLGAALQGFMLGAPVAADTFDAAMLPGDPTTVQIAVEEYTDIAIGGDGTITGRDGDGELFVLGRVALARVPNAGGLERAGNGLYRDNPAAGGLIVGAPGGAGLGSLQAGTLEMSNVDMAQEFTNLILAQRGFQANARTISTSDELLQELVNLKR